MKVAPAGHTVKTQSLSPSISRFTPVALEACSGWHKDFLKEMKRLAEACVPVRSELEDVEKAKNRIFLEFSVKFRQITAEMIIARM